MGSKIIEGSAELHTGIVLWFDPIKKYGFITDLLKKQDFFFHVSSLEPGIAVVTDDKVSFKADSRNGKPFARDVKKL